MAVVKPRPGRIVSWLIALRIRSSQKSNRPRSHSIPSPPAFTVSFTSPKPLNQVLRHKHPLARAGRHTHSVGQSSKPPSDSRQKSWNLRSAYLVLDRVVPAHGGHVLRHVGPTVLIDLAVLFLSCPSTRDGVVQLSCVLHTGFSLVRSVVPRRIAERDRLSRFRRRRGRRGRRRSGELGVMSFIHFRPGLEMRASRLDAARVIMSAARVGVYGMIARKRMPRSGGTILPITDQRRKIASSQHRLRERIERSQTVCKSHRKV